MDTNRDRALCGLTVRVSDARLLEMQRQTIRNEGVGFGAYHWHYIAVINELIECRRRRSDVRRSVLLGFAVFVLCFAIGTGLAYLLFKFSNL